MNIFSRPSAVRPAPLLLALLLSAIAPLAIARPAAASEWSPQERAEFLNSCTTSAARDERVSQDQARNFCQCVLNGFSIVSDTDRQAFVNNRYNPQRWPETIRSVLNNCRQLHVQ